MKFLAAPSLLLLSTQCLSPSDKPMGVNGFALPLPSHTSTRSIGNKINHDSRLWMTSSDSLDALDNSDDVDADLPKLKKKLTREFFSIGFPAFIQLAAEPLAALVVCHSSCDHTTWEECLLEKRMLTFVNTPQNCQFFVFSSQYRILLTSVDWGQRFWVEQVLQFRPSTLCPNYTTIHC